MAFETLGINFVLKGVTQAAQNWSYMAGAIMRFGSQYARIEAQIKKYYGAENNLVQKSINYWTRYWVMLQKDIDKTVISIGTLRAKILAYSNAHISMTARQTVIYAEMQSNLSDLIDKVVDLKDEQVNASDIVINELNKQNIIYYKLQQKLNELSNPISAFFSMLTGGWAKGILEGTQFGTMLMKLVPSAVAISVALDVVKLAVNAIAYAIKFGQALWNWLWNIIGKVTSAAWNLAKSVLKYLADVIVDVGKKVVTWLVDKFKAFISLPFRIANDALGSLVNMFKQIFAVTAGVSLDRILNNVATAIKNVGARAWTAAVDFQSLKLRLQGLLQREISEGQTTKVPVIKNIIPSGAQLEALDDLNQKLSILQDKVTIAQQNFAKKGTLQTKVALDSAVMSVEAMEEKISKLSSGMSGTYTVMEKLTTGTMSFAQALPMAKKQVIELTEWISDWAMKTKFNAVTIANAFTLAMSYGFGSEGAKKLIVDISQFTTGMGLGNEEFTRIIENFGQMIQQGKLTGTELRDLARGAFMPINKILGIMGENLGLDNLQIGEMKKKIQSMTSEGEIDLNQFFTAFGQMVGVDFPDAVATMQASWAVMQSNLKEDFVEAIIGWRVITPIIDKIGARLNVLVNQLITPQMKQMWSEFGENLAFVVDQFMTLFDTLTGGSGSRIITWMGNFVTRINNVIGVYRKIIDNNIVKTWGRKTAIYMLLDALGISDPSRSIGNAIDKTITKIQNLWTAISNSPTVLGKSQILLDFFNKEILPVITNWFTNVLFPGIKNLITTYGPELYQH